jgi:hypothetical protein
LLACIGYETEASKTEHERRIFLERNLASTRPMILINFL